MIETECSRGCGYLSHGDDLLDHETREHVTCTECGNEPHDFYPVSHKPDCSRLAPAGEGSRP